MRPGIIAENLLERMVLASGMVPVPLVNSYWGMAVSRCLLSSVRLGVFDALVPGEKSAEEVAKATGCDPVGMETLLNALNGFGYLKRRRRRYALTRQTRKWLTQSSPSSLSDAFLFMAEIWNYFSGLEDVVRTGKTPRFHRLEKDAEFWSTYLRGLAIFARFVSREITSKVKLAKAPERLLDVGGGHGIYSVAFCKKYPALQSEVLDLAPACEQGKKIIGELGFSQRIIFRAGDFMSADWGKGYQAVLLFNIIHAVPQEDAKKIIANAFQALSPGGTVVILDSEHQGGENNLSATAGFNELFFFLINGTRVYPQELIFNWIKAAGFSKLKKKKLLRMPMTLFLTARK